MKHTLLLITLALPAHAELLATFHTDRGNVTVSLEFEKTPQTVANFITLAQGTRTRIDPVTGAVIRKPLYAGETFYQVVTDAFSGGYAQTGSGTGTVNGGPGYTFRDEIVASLPHGPYILAMQNEGTPHTNGSQIYFTGENGYPPDEEKNTVFGTVTTASRSVVDDIIQSGNNGTIINSISFQRTSGQALAFNEHAQQLPECTGFAGNLEVVSGEYVKFLAHEPQPAGSFLFFSRSLNLQDWGAVNNLAYQATGALGNVDFIIDDGIAKRAFYHFSNVKHPDALAPGQSVLAGDTLSLILASGRNMGFNFTSEQNGTFTDSATSGSAAFTLVSYVPEPYKAVFIMESGVLSYRFDCLLDDEVNGQAVGRCVAYQKSGDSWISLGAGTLNLTQNQ